MKNDDQDGDDTVLEALVANERAKSFANEELTTEQPLTPAQLAALDAQLRADDEVQLGMGSEEQIELGRGSNVLHGREFDEIGAEAMRRRTSQRMAASEPATARQTPVPHQTPRPGTMPRASTPLVAEQDAALKRKLESLAGLGLDKSSPVIREASPPSRLGAAAPWLVLMVVVVAGGFYHFKTVRELEEKIASKPAAAVAKPDTPMPSGLLASGYIAARDPIVLSATTSGRLLEMKVEAGDTITKGQILAVQDAGGVRAELALAAARVNDAARAHQRAKMLVKAQAGTRVDLERAQGAVEVAHAEMRVIQQKLDDTRIKSPINGTVLEVLARPGETITVTSNQAAGVLRIADLSALVAEVDVGEAELKNVYIGQQADVISEAQRDRPIKGIVREIAEQADRARGTVLVRVEIIPDKIEPAPAPATPVEEAKPEPKPKAKTVKTKPNKKEVEKAPEPAPPAPTVDMHGLKPGMAVQVRFTPRPTAPLPQ